MAASEAKDAACGGGGQRSRAREEETDGRTDGAATAREQRERLELCMYVHVLTSSDVTQYFLQSFNLFRPPRVLYRPSLFVQDVLPLHDHVEPQVQERLVRTAVVVLENAFGGGGENLRISQIGTKVK